MKRLHLLCSIIILFSFLSCQQVVAQEEPVAQKNNSSYADESGKRVLFNVCFGPNISWFYPKTEDYTRSGLTGGMHYGIGIDINLSDQTNYYFTTGVQFEHVGGQMTFRENLNIIDTIVRTVETERSYNSIYLTIPTAITLKTPSFKNFVIGGNFGLYHSFLLSSKSSDKFTTATHEVITGKTHNGTVSFFKESAFVGLGVEYIIKKDFRAKLYINYVHTLTNYFKGNGKANNTYSELAQKATMGNVEFILGVCF
ncbi:MAG: outer membrane beta-barrel protein [Bacteroidales bacterium]